MHSSTLNDRRAEIGRILKLVREHTGRHQAQVAESAGISPSMLSQIERGGVAPSIDTLFQLCAALDIEVAELFRRVSPGKPVRVVGKSSRLRSSSEAGIVFEQLVASAASAYPAEMYQLEIAAGKQAGISGRGHEGVELGTVLCGQARLTVDGAEHLLGEGDSVSFSSLLPHRLENAGPRVFRAVWVVMPPHRDLLDT